MSAGKSLKWVAEQLGHSNPELTLRTYSHVLKEEEVDLSFAEFDGRGRPYTAPASNHVLNKEGAVDISDRQPNVILERETGVEPATLSLGS